MEPCIFISRLIHDIILKDYPTGPEPQNDDCHEFMTTIPFRNIGRSSECIFFKGDRLIFPYRTPNRAWANLASRLDHR